MSQNIYDDEIFFKSYSLLPRSKKGYEFSYEWPYIKSLLPDIKDKKVLDLGCGYGWFCREALNMKCEKVWGFDISKKMLNKAKEFDELNKLENPDVNLSKIIYVNQDLENATFIESEVSDYRNIIDDPNHYHHHNINSSNSTVINDKENNDINNSNINNHLDINNININHQHPDIAPQNIDTLIYDNNNNNYNNNNNNSSSSSSSSNDSGYSPMDNLIIESNNNNKYNIDMNSNNQYNINDNSINSSSGRNQCNTNNSNSDNNDQPNQNDSNSNNNQQLNDNSNSSCNKLNQNDCNNYSDSRLLKFDFVLGVFIFHYIKNIEDLFQKIFRSLNKGGCLVFSVEHPIYMASKYPGYGWIPLKGNEEELVWPVSHYSYEGERTRTWLGVEGIKKQHRTIGSYINLLIKVGFKIDHVNEWSPNDNQIRDFQLLSRERERPIILIIKAIK